MRQVCVSASGLFLAISVASPVVVAAPDSIPQNLLIVAHRGASAVAPENTLAAFRKAMEFRATAIELDVRQTRDSQLVILHDATVDRTTDGKGDVAALTLMEVKALDAGGWFDPDFQDERIPALHEVMEILDSATILIIEIKGGSGVYPGIEERVLAAVTTYGLEDRVILKSFDRDVLRRIREKAPHIRLLYVYVFAIPWLNIIVDHGVSAGDIFVSDVEYLQPHKIFLSKPFVRHARKRGFTVIVWDVDDKETMRKMIDLGVDGIETDHPDRLHEVLHE